MGRRKETQLTHIPNNRLQEGEDRGPTALQEEDRRRRDNRKSPCTLLSCEYQEGEDRGPTALQEEDRRRRDNRKSTCNCNRMSVCKRQNGKWGCVSMFS